MAIFFCLHCPHSFRTENKLKSCSKVCENKDFSSVVKPSQKDNMLKFNHYMESNKILYIIYLGLEPLIKIIDR